MEKLHFEQTPLQDAWIVKPDPYIDNRGRMIRTFCRNEFMDYGIDFNVAQCNASINRHAGTLRGLHFQLDPVAKSKLVRCVRGSVYDVIVDMRMESATYLQHFGIELTAENLKMIVIPKNFAHGFLTLEDDTELHYMVNNFYTPEYGRGIRYNDPMLGIDWPIPVNVISDQDKNWPLLEKDSA